MSKNWIAYERKGGMARKLLQGDEKACLDYIFRNPVGPFGGFTHIRFVG